MSKTKEIVYIGIMSSLIIVATFINIVIPFGQGGLVHLGTVVSVISVLVFNTKIGMWSGALGMTIFDIIGGWFIWAPATFVARIGLGYILGKFAYSHHHNANNWALNTTGLILGGLWMIAIYYFYEVIIYSNWIVPLGSIMANVAQIVLAFIIGFPISYILNRSVKKNIKL